MKSLIKKIFAEEHLNSVLIIAVFLFLTAWWVIHSVFKINTITGNTDVWGSVYQIVAILGCYIGFFIIRKSGGHTEPALPFRAIQIFSTGLLFQALGQAVYTFYVTVLNVVIPYPSLADVFYGGSVPFYLLAIIFLVKTVLPPELRKKVAMLAVVFFLVAIGAEMIFLIKTSFPFVWGLKSCTTIIYIFFETAYAVIAISALVVSHFFRGHKFRIGLILLAIGLCLQFIAEFNYFYTIRIGAWTDGGFGDFLYLFTYFISSLGLVQFTYEFVAINILVVIFNSFFFFQFLLSGRADRFFSNGIILAVCAIISYFLLRRNKNEVAQKEKLVRLEALEESNRKLTELDRQKTEFLNIAAHQLRTPVSIIRNYVSMMQDGDFGEVPEQIKEVHDHIYQSNQWLVRLADEFLNLSKLESGQLKYHLEEGDIAKAVDEVVAEIKPKATEKGLKLEYLRPNESLPAVFDIEKIKHATMNLVENAVKYTPEGNIVVIVAKDQNSILVTVTDTGIGFSAEDLPNLFQKFRRGKNAHQIEVNTSTGLGLYIAKMFVEGHNGRVWAKSEGPGKGSEFGFWVPGVKKMIVIKLT